MKAIAMTQHIRNQLSLLAWLIAAFCAWWLFMAAAAASHPAHAEYTASANTTQR